MDPDPKPSTPPEPLSQTDRQDLASSAGSWAAALYIELRDLAARHFRFEPGGHTLQPTAVVHEAYLRLTSIGPDSGPDSASASAEASVGHRTAGERPGISWSSKTSFMAAAAVTLRRVLIDHARRRRTIKRTVPRSRLLIPHMDAVEARGGRNREDFVDVLMLDEALQRLAVVHPRAARVVELRFFGGLTPPQAAGLLSVSLSTAEGDWRFARAWLTRELSTQAPDDAQDGGAQGVS